MKSKTKPQVYNNIRIEKPFWEQYCHFISVTGHQTYGWWVKTGFRINLQEEGKEEEVVPVESVAAWRPVVMKPTT